MFCTNCGKLVADNAVICPSCGFNIAGAVQQTSTTVSSGYNGDVPPEPMIPDVPLEQPMALNDGTLQDLPVQQDYDPNAGEYQYQQNYDPNAGGYQYQQNYDPNAGGYQYQQGVPQGTGYYDGLNAGSPEQQWNGGAPGQPGSSAGSGAALACGICSICIGFLGGLAFGVIGALIGLALGIVGLILSINFRKANNGGANGGLVTSIVGLALSFVLFLGCAACGASSKGYGCLGCVGGSCSASNDISDGLNSFKYYYK